MSDYKPTWDFQNPDGDTDAELNKLLKEVEKKFGELLSKKTVDLKDQIIKRNGPNHMIMMILNAMTNITVVAKTVTSINPDINYGYLRAMSDVMVGCSAFLGSCLALKSKDQKEEEKQKEIEELNKLIN